MSKKEKIENLEPSNQDTQIDCGLIMPIAPMPGYSSNQFKDVKSILVDTINSIQEYNFNPRLVSDSNGEVDIIHKSIVNNIYDDPIVVVDISGKNGNVMLELGLRLAFDKPLIIIKDDKTDYMFDISMIEHITYPSDLRHNEIELFKNKIAEKIVKTYQKSIEDSEYSPFLKHFQHIKVKSIGEQNIDQSQMLELILSKLSQMEDRSILQAKKQVEKMRINKNSINTSGPFRSLSKRQLIEHFSVGWDPDEIPDNIEVLKKNKKDYARFSNELNRILSLSNMELTSRMLDEFLIELNLSLI